MLKSIRVSVGTAALLAMLQCKIDASPTTAYTMIYSEKRCHANCGFCAQARDSTANANKLSRVTWPTFALTQVIKSLTHNAPTLPVHRLCIQTLYYPSLFKDLKFLVTLFRQQVPSIPISLAIPPFSKDQLQHLSDKGVDRVAISLDAVTPEIFNTIKGRGVNGPFTWDQHHQALESALSIFGTGRTTTHLIIGLGEKEIQTVNLIQKLTNQGITIGLFPFAPIPGTTLAERRRPTISHYRRIQLAHYLIQNHLSHSEYMQFHSSGKQITNFGISTETIIDIIARGKAFQTAGCPSCNRPFFTEQPGGPLYNYPQPPDNKALIEIRNQLGGVL